MATIHEMCNMLSRGDRTYLGHCTKSDSSLKNQNILGNIPNSQSVCVFTLHRCCKSKKPLRLKLRVLWRKEKMR